MTPQEIDSLIEKAEKLRKEKLYLTAHTMCGYQMGIDAVIKMLKDEKQNQPVDNNISE